jgi:D-alanyl-D-alanine carboxypeptidase (penicillin-binding protein 5/6)
MLHSGNDAAAAIAEHIGGTIDGFVDMMNERAIELGMLNTHFANPNGLDASGHYSTPRDMLILARQAMSMPEFAELARSRVMVFPDAPNGTPRTATNTNRILNSYAGVIGVKTGETPNAGLTYVGAAERQGRRIYVVLFHSVGPKAHFVDAIALYDWAFRDLGIQGTLALGIPYQTVAEHVAEPPLLVEAETDDPTSTLSTPPATNEVGPDEVSAGTAGVRMTRHPDPAPDSILSTLTYWMGLIRGTFGG